VSDVRLHDGALKEVLSRSLDWRKVHIGSKLTATMVETCHTSSQTHLLNIAIAAAAAAAVLLIFLN
jgi:hypothetical protein